MGPNGPPGDFDHQPREDHQPSRPVDHEPGDPLHQQFDDTELLDSFAEGAEPTPWYRKPLWLIGWGLLVIILIGLIVYGITELIRGGQGTGNTPPTRTTVPSTTITTTTTAPPSSATTTASTPPSTSSTAEPPPQTEQPNHQPTRRRHLPALPSVITIPGIPTVITLPPGLR